MPIGFLAFNPNLLFLLIKELVIGLIIGFAAILFWAVIPGFIIDTARGVNGNCPRSDDAARKLNFGQLFTYLLTAIFS